MFCTLPFGVSWAAEFFQKRFKQIFDGIKGQVSYIDDLLVFGKTRKEHHENLENVLKRAQKENIKFNNSICQ